MGPLFGGVDHSIFDGGLGRIQMRGFSIKHGTGHGTCSNCYKNIVQEEGARYLHADPRKNIVAEGVKIGVVLEPEVAKCKV